MTWTNLAAILLPGYLAYYGLNLLYDMVIHKKPPGAESPQNVLVFQESQEPVPVSYRDDEPEEAQAPVAVQQAVIATGPTSSTGAVGILELLNLAKDDLIQYTKAIPY